MADLKSGLIVSDQERQEFAPSKRQTGLVIDDPSWLEPPEPTVLEQAGQKVLDVSERAGGGQAFVPASERTPSEEDLAMTERVVGAFTEPAQQLAEQFIPAMPQTRAEFLRRISGVNVPVLEAGAALATGMAGMTAGGLAGTAALPAGVTAETPAADFTGLRGVPAAQREALTQPLPGIDIGGVMEDVASFVQYEPRSQAGQAITALTTAPIVALQEVGHAYGNAVFDVIPNKAVAAPIAAMVASVPEGLLMLSAGAKHLKESRAKKGADTAAIEQAEFILERDVKQPIEQAIRQVKEETGMDLAKELGLDTEGVMKLEPVEVYAVMKKLAEKRKSEPLLIPPKLEPKPIPAVERPRYEQKLPAAEPLTGKEIDAIDYTSGIAELAKQHGVDAGPGISVYDVRSKLKAKLGLTEKQAPIAIDDVPVQDTRGGGTQYHGSSTKIPEVREDIYSPENIYGQGFYTTDAIDVAGGYSKKGSGADRVVYKVEPKKVKIKDMEQPLDSAFTEWVQSIGNDLAEAALVEKPKNLREFFDEVRDISAGERVSQDTVQGLFDSIQTHFKEEGYGAFQHIGGLKTNHKPHNVIIYFPEVKPTLKAVTVGDFAKVEKPPAPTRRKLRAEEKAKIREEALAKRKRVQAERKRVQTEEGIEFEEFKRRAPERLVKYVQDHPDIAKTQRVTGYVMDQAVHNAYRNLPSNKRSMKLFVDQVREMENFRERNFEPVYSKKNAALEIDRGVERGVFNKEQAKVLKEITSALKKTPDVTWLKDTRNAFNQITKEIRLKDPISATHELGHWAFSNVLTPKERIRFLETMEKFFDSGVKMDDLLALKSKTEFKTAEGKATVKTNHARNFNEYFAEQFAQYVNNKLLSEPQYRTLMEKVVGFVKRIRDAGREKQLFDKDLQGFFDSIIDADKIKSPEAEIDAGVARMMEMLEKSKARRKRQAEASKIEDELNRDLMKYDTDTSYDVVIEQLQKGTDITEYKKIYDAMKKKFADQRLDIDVGLAAAEKAPKTIEGYSELETAHFNNVIHDAWTKGLGFEEIYRKKGVGEREAKILTAGAEKYAEALKAEHVKVHGPQVNKVWKNEKQGVLNTPLFRKDIETFATVTPQDFPGNFGDFLMTPASFFDRLGPKVTELTQGKVKDAQLLVDTERYNSIQRLQAIKKIVKRKDRQALDNFTFTQQRNGTAYLKAIGEKVPTWSELSPEAQVAYAYMRNEYKNFFNRLNMMRRMNGQKPFKETANYFTFMSDLATMEQAGMNSVLVEAGKFNEMQAKLSATPFRYSKARRQIELDNGAIIKMEHDSFKRFEIYQNAAIRHIYFTPALSSIAGSLRQTLQLPRRVVAGKLASERIQKQIEAGKIKATDVIDYPSKFVFSERAPAAATYLQNYVNATALGRQLRLGEKGTVGAPKADAVINGLLEAGNRGLTQSLLAGSVRLALIQPGAIANTLVYAGGTLPGAVVKSLSPKARAFALNTSTELRGRIIGAHLGGLTDAVFSGGSILHKVDLAKREISQRMLTFTRVLDGEIAMVSWQAFYEQAQRQGLNKLESKRYADTHVVKTQGSGRIQDLAPIQRSLVGKSVTLFQTFAISQYNLLRYDIVGRGGKKPTDKIYVPDPVLREGLAEQQASLRAAAKAQGINPKRITKKQAVAMAARFAIASALFNALYEDVIGIDSPNPTPLRTAKRSYEDGDQIDTVLIKAMRESAGYLPGLGGLAYGSGVAGALYSGVERVLKQPTVAGIAEQVATLYGVPGLSLAKIARDAFNDQEENPAFYLIRRKAD